MSTSFERPLVAELRHGLNALRGNWLWFVVLGMYWSPWASSPWARW